MYICSVKILKKILLGLSFTVHIMFAKEIENIKNKNFCVALLNIPDVTIHGHNERKAIFSTSWAIFELFIHQEQK